MNQRTVSKRERYLPLIATVVLVLPACRGNDETSSRDAIAIGPTTVAGADSSTGSDETTPTTVSDADGQESAPTTSPTTEPPVESVEATVPPTTIDDGLELETFEALDLGDRAVQYSSSAMGGIQFTADSAHRPLLIGDRIFVTPVANPSNETSGAYIALLSQGSDGTSISTVQDVLNRVEAIEQFSVEPTGTAISLFGYRLAGYDVIVDGDPGRVAPFGATRRGGPPRSLWTPSTEQPGRFYASETPSGVLIGGYPTGDEELEALFGTLIETAELTGGGLDPAIQPGVPLDSQGPPPRPAEIAETGPRVLDTQFSPLEPNTYQIPNFGLQMAIDIPDGWETQPNVPGLVVFTQRGSAGPGDRDLTFIVGVKRSLAALAGGPRRVGAPYTFTELSELLASPPDGLEISNIIETEIAGFPVTRFDLNGTGDRDCSMSEPCDFLWETNWGFTQILNPVLRQRVWWFDTPGATHVVTATDVNPDHIERATAIVESATAVGN